MYRVAQIWSAVLREVLWAALPWRCLCKTLQSFVQISVQFLLLCPKDKLLDRTFSGLNEAVSYILCISQPPCLAALSRPAVYSSHFLQVQNVAAFLSFPLTCTQERSGVSHSHLGMNLNNELIFLVVYT